MKVADKLKTLSIDNTGDRLKIKVNGEDIDTTALTQLDIQLHHGLCEIQLQYNNWLSLSRVKDS